MATKEVKLPTRKLGKHGPDVTALGYGTMGLSAFYGAPKPDAERFALLDHIFAAGERHWDTADIYGDSEDLLGRWFARNPGKREQIFLATKFANVIDPHTGARSVRNDPAYIRQAVDRSLARLGVPYVDLYYVHRIDPQTPIETTVGALKALQAAGKIRHIGLSECSAETVRRAERVVHIDAVQVEYSLFATDIEHAPVDLLRTCRELGVATVAYSPLGRGFLSGAIKSPDDFEQGDFRRLSPRFSPENFDKNLVLLDSFTKIADRKGVTPSQLALAWLLAQGDDIIPIPGTTSLKRFDENLKALDVSVSEAENKEIRHLLANTQVHGARYPEAMSKWLYADTVPLKG